MLCWRNIYALKIFKSSRLLLRFSSNYCSTLKNCFGAQLAARLCTHRLPTAWTSRFWRELLNSPCVSADTIRDIRSLYAFFLSLFLLLLSSPLSNDHDLQDAFHPFPFSAMRLCSDTSITYQSTTSRYRCYKTRYNPVQTRKFLQLKSAHY